MIFKLQLNKSQLKLFKDNTHKIKLQLKNIKLKYTFLEFASISIKS